jgi:putative solute:sodium symporter small subunit
LAQKVCAGSPGAARILRAFATACYAYRHPHPRRPPVAEEERMASLTPEQRESYWRYNVKLTIILLAIWFVVTYLLGGIWAAKLNEIVIFGFPLGYYVAAQGSLAIFVVEIAIYAKLMNAKDLEYGIREEG